MAYTSSAKEFIKKKLTDDKTFGTSILAIALDEFGTDMFSWEPATIRMDISDIFGVEMTRMNENKLWSLITALSTNQFYVSLEVFTATCDFLSNDDHDFGVMTPNTPFELAWGVTEVLLNDPFGEGHPSDEFSNEIESYTGIVLSENSLLLPPKMLAFAQYPTSNPVLDLDTAFVDDPDMFQAAYGNQTQERIDLEARIELQVQELLRELGSLPLQNSNKALMQKLQTIGK